MRRHGEATRGRRRGAERGAGERWRWRWRLGEDAEQYKKEAASAKKKLDAVVERYNTMKKKAKASLDEAKAEIASLKSKPAPEGRLSEALEQAQSKLEGGRRKVQRA